MTSQAPNQPDDLDEFDEFLTECVQRAVGTHARPRPGQQSLARRIVSALADRHHSLDLAPTGTGKSLASLAAAAWRSMAVGERTIISTHNLGLLDQYVAKDALPVIEAAGDRGHSLTVRALKGVNNYVDPRRLLATVAQLLSLPVLSRPIDVVDVARRIGEVKFPQAALAELAGLTGGDPLDADALRRLVVWALGVLDDDEEPGDRQSCPVPVTEREWACVSATSSEAAKDEEEGFGFIPKAVAAKDAAGVADIVVTNHVLLAIQAANGINVVIGSRRLGDIDHVIVDEAHMLPSAVRAQGAIEVSGRVLGRVARSVKRAGDGSDSIRRWGLVGDELADELDRTLGDRFRSQSRDAAMALGEGDDPLGEELRASIESWAASGKKLLGSRADTSTHDGLLKAQRAAESCERLIGSLAKTAEHRIGVARWIDRDRSVARTGNHRPWFALEVSPVAVGGAINRHLWHQEITEGSRFREQLPPDRIWTVETQTGPVDLAPLGVACLSATIPTSFRYDAGLRADLVEHPSPFTDAYGRSMLFVPAVTDDQVHLVSNPGYRGRPKFDTYKKYPAWARNIAGQLARANGGRALVLTAKSADGKAMAKHLREVLDVSVYSQWDGEAVDRVKTRWVLEEQSVLVGTKSLMTGVDAPGETCSLVIIDRPPRAAGNPADDARLEAFMQQYEKDKWSADRLVYVADAATDLQQAAGRLIRAEQDSGMVAILEPRLLQGGALSYQEQTRTAYLRAVSAFPNKEMRLDHALRWLEERQRSR
ncbi:MAG: ATP-dependent DNA helicase [Microbacteriaceae bacterium]